MGGMSAVACEKQFPPLRYQNYMVSRKLLESRLGPGILEVGEDNVFCMDEEWDECGSMPEAICTPNITKLRSFAEVACQSTWLKKIWGRRQ